MDSLDQELEQILQRRERVKNELGRLRGRKEQAEENLRAVEDEMRAKGIEPTEVDQRLAQLESKYAQLVEQLRQETDAAERALMPFVSGAREV